MQKNSAKNFMKPKYLEKDFTRTLSFERQQEYGKLLMLIKQKKFYYWYYYKHYFLNSY